MLIIMEIEKAEGVIGLVVEMSSVLGMLRLSCSLCVCVYLCGVFSGIVVLSSFFWVVGSGKLLLISSILSF